MKKLVSPVIAFPLALLSLSLVPAVAQSTPKPPPGCVNPVCTPRHICPEYICPLIHSQITSDFIDGRFHFTY